MGKAAQDFNWGSSSNTASQGIALIQAHRLTADTKYLPYVFITWTIYWAQCYRLFLGTRLWDKTPLHPHHRPLVADQIAESVPGLLSGGPNACAPQQGGRDSYTDTAPEATFTDDDCSDASNEIAINWNAPLTYLVSAIEVLQDEVDFSVKE